MIRVVKPAAPSILTGKGAAATSEHCRAYALTDERRRARSHTDDISKERPLLVDPVAEDPAEYLGFRKEYVFAIDGCREGAATIEILGLNREDICEVRRDRLARLDDLLLLRTLLQERIRTVPTQKLRERLASVEGTLHSSAGAAGEFAAMTRALLADPSAVSVPFRIGF